MISIYKASAGSGKTFTLAYQYIKMLLGHKQPGENRYRLDTRSQRRHRSILAITFTNKATEEMKQRIIHELAVIAGAEPGWTEKSRYADRLCRELGASQEQIADEARRALSELLFDYGFFAVSTIDSFFQQVLRTFAREADLTGNYEVDLDNDALIELAIVQLFRSLGTESSPATRRTAKWLSDFLRSRMMSGETVELFNRNSNLFRELHQFVGKSLNETFTINARRLTAYLSDPEAIARLSDSVEKRIREADTAAKELCLTALRMAEGREGLSSLIINALRKFAESGIRNAAATGTTIVKAAENPASVVKKDKKSQLLLADSSLIEAIGNAAQSVIDGITVMKSLRPIRKNIHFLGLLSDVIHQMDILRRDNNMLLLSDTNGILAEIIGDDDTPFLYERMGIWLENFLIDEFQDTSLMQWNNLRPLLAEGQATDRDSLIIGDEKQCIYRFRSSDPTLLQHQVQDSFGNRAEVHGATAEGNTNWRSSATVVNFNNHFFSKAADVNGISDIYANVVQAIPANHSDYLGYVSVNKATGKGVAEATAEGYSRMADEIARQINLGYRPCDIAILGRNTAHAAGAIAYLLRRQAEDAGYPRFRIISDDSIEIGRSKAVKLVISVLRSLLLSRPGDEAAAETVERRRHNRTLEDIVLARLINDYEYGCAQGLAPDESLSRAVASSRRQPDDSSVPYQAPELSIDGDMVCPNLQTLVDRVIATFIDKHTLAAEDIYITAFQDLTASFAMKGGADLREFLNWWDTRGRRSSVASQEADDTLRVMTIHKSKGLEFKCVHIPVADWDMARFKDTEWFEVPGDIAGVDASFLPPLIPLKPGKDLADTPFAPQYERRVKESLLDETNTLYVAFTRAVEELIVTYSPTPGRSGGLIETTLTAMGYADGSFVAGEPDHTIAVKSGSRTALVPSGSINIVPRIPAYNSSLWTDTRLDLPADPLTPRGRGVIIHDVLAHIGNKEDLPRAIRQMVSIGVVPRNLADEVTEILSRELERPEVIPWFSGFKRFMAERPIVTGADADLRKRPDRVVWTADGHVDVIDYKSGEEHKNSYRKQVAGYMRQLRQLGYRQVRGFIWYLDTGEIISVPPD